MSDRSKYLRRRREKRRSELRALLGGKCARCGSTKDLQFDHTNPKKKYRRIADLLDAPKDVLMAEVKLCVLLCAKCHRDKTREKGEHGQPKARHGTIWMYKKYRCRCRKCKGAMSKYNRNRRMQMLRGVVASFDSDFLTKFAASGEEVVSWFKSRLQPMGVEVIDTSKEAIILSITNLEDAFDAYHKLLDIQKEIDSHGWYITTNIGDAIEGGMEYGEVELFLHPIRGEQIEAPGKVYHVAPHASISSIIKEGLKPKGGRKEHGFNFPPRVFVTKSPYDALNMDLGFPKDTKLTIFEIDVSKIPSATFFLDPQFPREDWASAYTTDLIPPEAISIFAEEAVKENGL